MDELVIGRKPDAGLNRLLSTAYRLQIHLPWRAGVQPKADEFRP